jgi:hypothetical protein
VKSDESPDNKERVRTLHMYFRIRCLRGFCAAAAAGGHVLKLAPQRQGRCQTLGGKTQQKAREAKSKETSTRTQDEKKAKPASDAH